MILRERIEVLGCPIDKLTMDQTIEIINDGIKNDQRILHVAVNAYLLTEMQKDSLLKESILSGDIINSDGQSVVWASRFLNGRLPGRVAGIDLMESLVELAHKKDYKVFFFGARENVVKKVTEVYAEKYSTAIIGGYRNGYFEKGEEQKIAELIAATQSSILFVALTSPMKEIFLNKYKHILNMPFVMSVGGSFDVISGFTKRAPKWMQKSGLEWFYRVIQEPKRMWKRYLYGNSEFIWLILKEKFKKKK